jgi:type I restriction enzyme S subunit
VNYHGIVDPSAIERIRYGDAPSRARRRVASDSTIISSVRPNLQAVAYIPDKSAGLICSTGFNVVEARPNRLTPKFVYYTLVSENARQYFEAHAMGVGYPAIAEKDFKDFGIFLPSIEEQKRIVNYLDASCIALDSAIAAKRRQIQTLDTFRKAMVTNAITGGLDWGVPRKFAGLSWLGAIPSHWTAPCLKRLLSEPLIYGLNEAAELDDRTLPRYIRITDFDDSGALRDETFRSLPLDVAQQAMLRPDDILFARSGATVGKTFIFREYKGEACFAGYLIRARTIPWKLLPAFLYHFTKTTAYENWKNLIFTQATIQNISATKYDYLSIPLPPLREQEEICRFIEMKDNEFSVLSEKIDAQICTLTAYRKSLIHECVTGQRRITDEDLRRVQDAAVVRP